MAGKPLLLSKHAQDMVDERDIPLAWVEHVLQNPIFAEPDTHHPERPALTRRSRSLAIACFASFIRIREWRFG